MKIGLTFSKNSDCDPDWIDKSGDSCVKYKEKSWCTPSGDYGANWPDDDPSETFEKYAKNGQTALVCPQCGCSAKGTNMKNTSPRD